MDLFDKDGCVTEAGAKLWNRLEEKVRKDMLRLHSSGVNLRDATLLYHDVIGAAAQHTLNRVATVRYVKEEKK